MKYFTLMLLLSPALGDVDTTTDDPHGAMGHEEEGHGEEHCCMEKEVGSVAYTLLREGEDTSRWSCKDGCVYGVTDHPERGSFCFATGELVVECLDEHGAKWCYSGDCGPDNWAGIAEACGGDSQSPIDIPPVVGSFEENDNLNYAGYAEVRLSNIVNSEADAITNPKGERIDGEISNNGHTAVLNVLADGDSDGILSGGPLNADYRMLQLHFHWGANDTLGSEHTIDGNAYPMEMHIVHVKVDEADPMNVWDGLAVVGQMFEISAEDNAVLTPLLDALTNIEDFESMFDMTNSALKVSDLLPAADAWAQGFAHYNGSLTTPTCNEAVQWLVYYKPIPISATQLAQFRVLKDSHDGDMVDNFRPVQPLNGRTIINFGEI